MSEKRIVATSLIATVTLVAIDEASKGNIPKPQAFIATIAAYMFLAGLLEVAPKLAEALAILVFVAVIYQRYGAFNRLFSK